jgi:IS30 family transposase
MKRKYRYLTLSNRNEIAEYCTNGKSPAEIAGLLDFNIATIYRELKRGGTGERDELGRIVYNAALAHEHSLDRIKKRGRIRRVGVRAVHASDETGSHEIKFEITIAAHDKETLAKKTLAAVESLTTRIVKDI